MVTVMTNAKNGWLSEWEMKGLQPFHLVFKTKSKNCKMNHHYTKKLHFVINTRVLLRLNKKLSSLTLYNIEAKNHSSLAFWSQNSRTPSEQIRPTMKHNSYTLSFYVLDNQ